MRKRMQLRSIRPWGGDPVDVTVEGDRITAVTPAAGAGNPGLLALSGFINTHAHVDKSWWGRPWVSYVGEDSTQGRIAHERRHNDELGIPGVPVIERVLREFLRHGTTAARTHLDVDLGVGLDSIHVAREAAAALDGAIELEIVAFPQDGVIRRGGVLELLEQAAASTPAPSTATPSPSSTVSSGLPTTTAAAWTSTCTAGGDLGAFEYELIIDRTRALGMAGKVNISHGFALGELDPAALERILDGLAEQGITWSTVAPVSSAPLPWREMLDRGIGIGLGTDGIRDLWSPYGDDDMLKIALAFARLHRVRHDEDFVGPSGFRVR